MSKEGKCLSMEASRELRCKPNDFSWISKPKVSQELQLSCFVYTKWTNGGGVNWGSPCLAGQVSYFCFVIKDGMNAKAIGANGLWFLSRPLFTEMGPLFFLWKAATISFNYWPKSMPRVWYHKSSHREWFFFDSLLHFLVELLC